MLGGLLEGDTQGGLALREPRAVGGQGGRGLLTDPPKGGDDLGLFVPLGLGLSNGGLSLRTPPRASDEDAPATHEELEWDGRGIVPDGSELGLDLDADDAQRGAPSTPTARGPSSRSTR